MGIWTVARTYENWIESRTSPPSANTTTHDEHSRNGPKLIERHRGDIRGDVRRWRLRMHSITSIPWKNRLDTHRSTHPSSRLSLLFSFEVWDGWKICVRREYEYRKIDHDAIFHILNCCGRVCTARAARWKNFNSIEPDLNEILPIPSR